jgi:hypothetical protein
MDSTEPVPDSQTARAFRVVERIGAVASIAGFIAVTIGAVASDDVKRDGYLPYYTGSAIIFIAWLWLALHLGRGEEQWRGAQAVFSLTAVLTLGAVVWRYMIVSEYILALSQGSTTTPPPGVCGNPTLWPYFVLLGTNFFALFALIFHYTDGEPNRRNRIHILFGLVTLAAWMMACRLGWEWVDHRAPPCN